MRRSTDLVRPKFRLRSIRWAQWPTLIAIWSAPTAVNNRWKDRTVLITTPSSYIDPAPDSIRARSHSNQHSRDSCTLRDESDQEKIQMFRVLSSGPVMDYWPQSTNRHSLTESQENMISQNCEGHSGRKIRLLPLTSVKNVIAIEGSKWGRALYFCRIKKVFGYFIHLVSIAFFPFFLVILHLLF